MAYVDYGGDGGGGYDQPPLDPSMGGGINTNDPSARSAGPAPTGTISPYDAVAGFYRNALGREGSAADINSWISGTSGNIGAIQQGIYGSPEAQAYSSRSAVAAPQPSPSSSFGDDASILAQIGRWASMPGADPSLANDPNYWLGAIKGRGGLNAGNLQFWQDASVGPTAFFRNPGRESGGGNGGGAAAPFLNSGTNPGGYTDPSSQIYLNQVLQRLSQVQQPQDNGVMDLLKSLALKRVDALNAPPYSAADEQALITRYREPLTQARDAAYQRNKETASVHGFLPSSGLLRRMDTNTNVGYEQGIAQGANQMGVNAVAQKQANAQQQLQILSSLLSADNQQFDRGQARQDQAVNLAKMFPDFDAQRLDQLLRASNDTSASSGISGLTQLGNLNLNTLGMNNANDQANSAAWGKLLASLLGAMG